MYTRRTQLRAPSGRSVPQTARSLPEASVHEEIATLKRHVGRLSKRRVDDEDDGEDDEDERVPRHRRRHERGRTERSLLYQIVCWGCEPGCCVKGLGIAFDCGCKLCGYVFTAAVWFTLAVGILYYAILK